MRVAKASTSAAEKSARLSNERLRTSAEDAQSPSCDCATDGADHARREGRDACAPHRCTRRRASRHMIISLRTVGRRDLCIPHLVQRLVVSHHCIDSVEHHVPRLPLRLLRIRIRLLFLRFLGRRRTFLLRASLCISTTYVPRTATGNALTVSYTLIDTLKLSSGPPRRGHNGIAALASI